MPRPLNHQTSIALDEETRRRIEAARSRLTSDTSRPSLGAVMRAAIRRGLDLIEDNALPRSSASARGRIP
jgi:predicted DNA-binding protein